MNAAYVVAFEELRAALMASAFASKSDEILATARPWIRLDPVTLEELTSAPRSWLGGEPELPSDIDWPTWDPTERLKLAIAKTERKIAEYVPTERIFNGKPMVHDARPFARRRIEHFRQRLMTVPTPLHFVCQIDLADAGVGAEFVGLPSDGILWFFNDPENYLDEPASWRVIYRPGRVHDLKRVATPTGIRAFSFTPVALHQGLTLGYQFSGHTRVEISSLPQKFWDSLQALFVLGGEVSDPNWCRPRVQRHRTSLAISDPITPQQWQLIEQESSDLRQLLHLESPGRGKSPDWQWGDMGALTFWLSDADWKEHRFENARMYLDST